MPSPAVLMKGYYHYLLKKKQKRKMLARQLSIRVGEFDSRKTCEAQNWADKEPIGSVMSKKAKIGEFMLMR